jgi:nucleoid-associated protein YgaU
MAGLFDFVKTIGKQIFGEGDADPAAKIKAEIEKDNPGVKDLGVKFTDGKVELTGSGSAGALQKAILIAGNAMGVAEVKVAGAATSVEDGTQYYVIKSGDTLSAIAKQFYGDANQYPKIFEANREVIKDADLIFPGQKIRIPKA